MGLWGGSWFRFLLHPFPILLELPIPRQLQLFAKEVGSPAAGKLLEKAQQADASKNLAASALPYPNPRRWKSQRLKVKTRARWLAQRATACPGSLPADLQGAGQRP